MSQWLWRHLAELVSSCALLELLDLRLQVGQTLLLVELLSQDLQLGEGQLQGETVAMVLGSVPQHVLSDRVQSAGTEGRRDGGTEGRRLS